jgi:hypothetical protein
MGTKEEVREGSSPARTSMFLHSRPKHSNAVTSSSLVGESRPPGSARRGGAAYTGSATLFHFWLRASAARFRKHQADPNNGKNYQTVEHFHGPHAMKNSGFFPVILLDVLNDVTIIEASQ